MDLIPPPHLGPWHVGEELGRGEFSGVFACSRDSSTGESPESWVLKLARTRPQQPAGKRVKGGGGNDDTVADRLLSWENQLYNGFVKNHPCFPKRPVGRDCYGEDQGWRWLAMERIHGGTLRKYVDDHGGMSLPVACGISARILDALHVLHDKGILFRDVKPENVMLPLPEDDLVTNRGVVLIDFGAACKYILHTGRHQDLGGPPVGTPRYMGLHVHQGAPASRRDDLESVGYMWMWMLRGGTLPWDGASSNDEVAKQKTVALTKLCNGLPSQVLQYFTSVRALDVADEPDYDELIGLMLSCGGLTSVQDKIDWDGGGHGRKAARGKKRLSPVRTMEAAPSSTSSSHPQRRGRQQRRLINEDETDEADEPQPSPPPPTKRRSKSVKRKDVEPTSSSSSSQRSRSSSRIASRLGMAAVLGVAGAIAASAMFDQVNGT